MARRARRPHPAVLVVLLTVLSGALVVAQPSTKGVDDRVHGAGETPSATDRAVRTAAAPPPSVAEAAPVPAPGPVPPPDDPYADEPLVELGTIDIPKIGLTHRLFQGVSLRSIDRGPSHWPGSALPGQPGNAVIAGHRVTHSRPFRHLDRLVASDQVVFTVGGVRTSYTVVGSEVVTPDALHILDPTPTPTATLFACHPPGSARYRLVVRLVLQPMAPALQPIARS